MRIDYGFKVGLKLRVFTNHQAMAIGLEMGLAMAMGLENLVANRACQCSKMPSH